MLLEKPISAAMVAASATAYYTAAASLKRAIVSKLTFYNSDTGAQTVTVHLVPTGGAASPTNKLIDQKSLLPGETWECFEAERQVLEGGGSIQCLASIASKISIMGTILEHSA